MSKAIMSLRNKLLGIGLLWVTCVMPALAQVAMTGTADLPSAQQAQAMTANTGLQLPTPAMNGPEIQQNSHMRWSTHSAYGPVNHPPSRTPKSIPPGDVAPFGSELFEGGFRGVRADGINPSYRVMPGDQVILRIWGAVDVDRVLPVDAQGNLFIPTIGPVAVQGINHSQLDGRIKAAVKGVYPENVHVYTHLQGAQPVAVFVTGYVNSPGRYAGVPNDSVLYFLDQAAGIDPQLGSYRRVRHLRGNNVLSTIDLYDFLLSGALARTQFQDGDTLFVEPRGPSVVVRGDVRREYRYELTPADLSGKALLDYARLSAGVSHVLVRGVRDTGPVSHYVDKDAFGRLSLADGDEVMFSADRRNDTIVVQLEGSFQGPSRFVLPKDATLHELLDSVPVYNGITDTSSVSIRRLSVAERQRESLKESLRRLETTSRGASSSTQEDAAIRVREAELIAAFVAKASQVEPNGRLIVAHNYRITDIRLQDGDVITLPERSDSLLISGEVLVPQSVVFTPGQDAYDYIERAGGFTQNADRDRVLVARQNGEVREARDVKIRAG
ncbi:MAG: polysaccharide biosynthesis/export family protein, partial [Gammaproteobacteria bacterium]|nr:polysaccharide biosynthesis/export family protein [Gammaproteobacteria bacterium]